MSPQRIQRVLVALGVLIALGLVGAVAADLGYIDDTQGHATVTVVGDNGTTIATVHTRVSDSYRERYRGLSGTKSLADGQGMLFVYDSAGHYAYVMRDMNYPLDIVFADANGAITSIHHAPVPPPGTSEQDLKKYRGYGKYVLEVPRGYTTRHGITVGDRIVVHRSS